MFVVPLILKRQEGVALPPDANFMSKSTRNTGKHWTNDDVKQLKSLAIHNTPTRVIGFKLGRTEASIESKAQAVNVSLKPVNRSPYNRRKA